MKSPAVTRGTFLDEHIRLITRVARTFPRTVMSSAGIGSRFFRVITEFGRTANLQPISCQLLVLVSWRSSPVFRCIYLGISVNGYSSIYIDLRFGLDFCRIIYFDASPQSNILSVNACVTIDLNVLMDFTTGHNRVTV